MTLSFFHPLSAASWQPPEVKEFEGRFKALERFSAAYRVLEAVVDSGAEESVAPPKMFPGPLQPSKMSVAGQRYRAANGSRIPNLGQKAVKYRTAEGHMCGMGFQIAEVERPLIAVSQLTQAGNSVTLRKDDGEIVHDQTGRKIALTRKDGVYIMKMWVPARGAQGEGDKMGAASFRRQGEA